MSHDGHSSCESVKNRSVPLSPRRDLGRDHALVRARVAESVGRSRFCGRPCLLNRTGARGLGSRWFVSPGVPLCSRSPVLYGLGCSGRTPESAEYSCVRPCPGRRLVDGMGTLRALLGRQQGCVRRSTHRRPCRDGTGEFGPALREMGCLSLLVRSTTSWEGSHSAATRYAQATLTPGSGAGPTRETRSLETVPSSSTSSSVEPGMGGGPLCSTSR